MVRQRFSKAFKWISTAFIVEHILKGALQAVGALIIYVFIIWLVIRSKGGMSVLRDALVLKSPGFSRLSSGSSTGEEQQ